MKKKIVSQKEWMENSAFTDNNGVILFVELQFKLHSKKLISTIRSNPHFSTQYPFNSKL